MPKKVLLAILIFNLISCENVIDEDIIIYSNDFEDGDGRDITNARFSEFNNSMVLGNFNNQEFQLNLNDIPRHDFIWVEFDLIIHDTWDGNVRSDHGPDKWFLEMSSNDNDKNPFEFKFETTFSNSVCNASFCHFQSYPQPFPTNSNFPRTGVVASANGLCADGNNPEGSSIFRISEVISHSESYLSLRCYDRLVSSSLVDDPSCDESWSIDNILIRAISI